MTALTTDLLGFAPDSDGWRKAIGGRPLRFRLLRAWDDLLAVEDLQRAVFGISEHDLTAASLLVVIPKTGGQILGALSSWCAAVVSPAPAPNSHSYRKTALIASGGLGDRQPTRKRLQ